MKKSKIVILFAYIIILIITLCGCNSNEKENGINEKVQSEIDYLDRKITGIMNKLNNITLENYEIKSREIVSQNGQESNQQGSSGGESSNQSSSEGGSESNQSSSGGSQENSKESSGGGQASNSIKVLQMQPSNILVINKDEIDWATIKSEIEVMYSTWNSILLDLYNINVANEDILNFSQALDNTVLAAKSEDKIATLEALANLYSFLPKYVDKISTEESIKNILKTKSNILNAYSLVEQENWDEIQNQINNADTEYTKVTNDVKYIEDKQEQVSRAYVLIKELKNSINLKDKDVFYIKYKNLMNAMQ